VIPLHLIRLQNISIFHQLQLEEALLRTDDRNFCLINIGSPRAVVMGISGQPETLLHLDLIQKDCIPVIQRFSGGGTVIVDEETLFITFIFSKNALNIPLFPEPLLRWTAELYTASWQIPGFRLQENDYVIFDKKCGGNAQYIKKDRCLHHTSFLWNYQDANMSYLCLPPKRPNYRQDRPHHDFLCRLKDYGSHSIPDRIASLQSELVKRFYIQDFDLKNWQEKPHRKTTSLMETL